MQKPKYQLKCNDCGGTWELFTDGKSNTGSNVKDILEVHELNCTPKDRDQK